MRTPVIAGQIKTMLVKYDAAKHALAEAHGVDEVKDVRDKALAMRLYAQQAKDDTLLSMATEIKARAERRAGELLRETAKSGARQAQGGDRKSKSTRTDFDRPTLKALGISRDQSADWQQIASIPEKRFETIVAGSVEQKAEVTTKALVTEARRLAKTKPRSPLRPDAFEDAGKWYFVEDWNKLSAAQKREIIDAGFADRRTTMNRQSSNAIEWALWSLNTVRGCLHNCPYCYARDIDQRQYPELGFKPRFYPGRLAAPANTTFSESDERGDYAFGNVFANSMSDLYGSWVPAEWIEATLEMARRNPKWRFLTLTKFPQRAKEFEFPDNVWMGTTVDAQSRVANAEKAFAEIRCKTKWISNEPMLQRLKFERLDLFPWFVMGGASASTQTPEWVPPFDWVSELHQAARKAGCRIYHKTNLKLPDELRVREFPWLEPTTRALPPEFHYLKGL